METRKSHVIVGAVTFLILLALLGFVLWLARYSRGGMTDYDIFFQQSVAGLNVGSSVSFSGVPVGQVQQIALMPETPQFIRVRVELQPDTPVLEGTTASLSAVGFTGVTEIQLSGSMQGQKPLNRNGPYGVPVIPARQSGFGQLLETAPQVLDRTATLLARLNDLFDDENRNRFGSLVDNLDRISAEVATQGPAIRASVQELEVTLKAATAAANSLAQAGDSANRLIDVDARPLLTDLSEAVTTANQTLATVNQLVEAARPGVEGLSTVTVPQMNRLIADLSDLSRRIEILAAKLDEDPASILSGNDQLPEYQQPGRRAK